MTPSRHRNEGAVAVVSKGKAARSAASNSRRAKWRGFRGYDPNKPALAVLGAGKKPRRKPVTSKSKPTKSARRPAGTRGGVVVVTTVDKDGQTMSISAVCEKCTSHIDIEPAEATRLEQPGQLLHCELCP